MTAINLQYLHDVRLGYGRYGTDLHHALTHAGVDVYEEMDGIEHNRVCGFDQEPRGLPRTRGLCDTAVWVTSPPHVPGKWTNQRLVLATMWETARLPETVTETLDSVDTLIVPSAQNVELYSEFHGDVRLAHIGIDTQRWAYQPRQAPNQEFRFLISGKNDRKGVDLAFRAFNKCFPEGSWGLGPTPVLWIKCSANGAWHADRVVMMPYEHSPAEEVDLYSQAHVYLQPSRGEGFGLQPLQAIASGLPTILTDAHGHTAFSDLGMPLSTTMTKAGTFLAGDAGQWWEPDFDELCDWMLYCYEYYDGQVKQAHDNAMAAHRRFSWSAVIPPYLDAIGDSDLLRNPGEWESLVKREYLVITKRRSACDIADVPYRFDPGVRYFVPADVKRVLFEAGSLADECLPPILSDAESHGLTPRQIALLGDQRARATVCPTCGREEVA